MRKSRSEARQSKQEWTYGILRARLLDGTYGPGHRLVIDALARELNVSQMPVREAIRRLEAEGWVVYQQNQGAQVAPIDDALFTEVMSTIALLQGYATAQAAPVVRAADLKRLRAINAKMREAIAGLDVIAVAEHNRAFHAAVCSRCGNEYLLRQLQVAGERLDSLRRTTILLFIPTRGKASADEHDELIEMLETGVSPDAIERFARQHHLHTLAAYEERRLAAGR